VQHDRRRGASSPSTQRTADATKTVDAAGVVGEQSEMPGTEGGESNLVSQLGSRIAGDVVGKGGS
jgi:hypothetical protein